MKSVMKRASGILAVLMFFTTWCLMDVVVAAPYQELPQRAGHIPVYIREGDQPLSEIHPGLAEAFLETEELQQKSESGESKVLNNNMKESNGSKEEKGINSSTSNPPETDIASFDVIKPTDDNGESLAKTESKDEGKSYEKKQREDSEQI